MASHPEQLRIQIEGAIESSIPYDDPQLVDIDLELIDVIQGKGSSHFIAIFYINQKPSYELIEYFNNNVKPEIMDGIASSISRRRLPNITFKLTNNFPNELPDLS